MELLNIFSRIGDWFSDQANAVLISVAISFVGGFFVKKGWTKTIDKIAKKGKVIAKEIGETFLAGSVFFDKVDIAINDDGTIEQNSVKEAIAAGKEVYIEGKDVIVSFKPKPQVKSISAQVPTEKKAKNKSPKYRHK